MFLSLLILLTFDSCSAKKYVSEKNLRNKKQKNYELELNIIKIHLIYINAQKPLMTLNVSEVVRLVL